MKCSIKTMVFLCLASCLFLIVSCGSDTSNKNTDQQKDDVVADADQAVDTKDDVIVETEIVDNDVAQPKVYPKTTTSSKVVGEIAYNFSFLDTASKPHKFEEYYNPDNTKAGLIWLVFSTYDCPGCLLEKNSYPSIYSKFKSRGLSILLVMNGSYQSGPHPENEPNALLGMKDAIETVYSEGTDFDFGYLSLADQAGFYRFIDQGFPVNSIIDAKTMKIIKRFEGWGADKAESLEIEKELEAYFDDFLD